MGHVSWGLAGAWFLANIGPIGEILTGIAAIYAALGGVKSYRQSVEAATVTTLIELEHEFRTVFPTVAEIEDDDTYRSEIAPALLAEGSNAPLDAKMRKTIEDVDLCFRFLYLLWVRSKLSRSAQLLSPVYYYYVALVLSRAELERYAKTYYPVVFELRRGMARRKRGAFGRLLWF